MRIFGTVLPWIGWRWFDCWANGELAEENFEFASYEKLVFTVEWLNMGIMLIEDNDSFRRKICHQ